METKDIFKDKKFLTEQLLYNCVMYLPLDEMDIKENDTVLEIISAAEDDNTKLSDAKKEIELYLPVIKSILENDETLGQCVINDFSWLDKDGDGKQDHPVNGMQACTFTNPSTKDTFVTFRGTPSGAWLDNGKMMIGLTEFCEDYTDNDGNTFKYMSSMQVEAVKYIDKLLGKYGENWFEGGKKTLSDIQKAEMKLYW